MCHAQWGKREPIHDTSVQPRGLGVAEASNSLEDRKQECLEGLINAAKATFCHLAIAIVWEEGQGLKAFPPPRDAPVGKSYPTATPETHPGHLGDGQHPYLLPSRDRGVQRKSEACVPCACPVGTCLSVHSIAHVGMGFTVPALAAPTPDNQASSMKTVF